ncbi:MAG TPA: hypothetical protein VK187_03090 [Geobacteraceae bacterium]|nr:hypothetical protein [Geobacteraceae bacterium]
MMSDNERCSRSGVRPTHMCELKQQGMMEEIDRRSCRPTVVCTKCGARANEAAYLCNPRPL